MLESARPQPNPWLQYLAETIPALLAGDVVKTKGAIHRAPKYKNNKTREISNSSSITDSRLPRSIGQQGSKQHHGNNNDILKDQYAQYIAAMGESISERS